MKMKSHVCLCDSLTLNMHEEDGLMTYDFQKYENHKKKIDSDKLQGLVKNFLKNGRGIKKCRSSFYNICWHTEAWWRRGNTFASHRYSLDLTLTPGHMWDVFHPSQLMPGGFPLGVFFQPQTGSKLFQLELSHKADWPGQNLLWVT